jgi:proline iminopeptidase
VDWDGFEVDGTVGWVSGEGEDVALLLHGGPGLSDYTDLMAPEVAAALPGHRLVRYQQRGLAPSTTDGPLTVFQLVADLFAVLDHLGGGPAVLIGHSWGGHLAMHAAVAHPERVVGMVLVDSLGAVGDGGQGTMQTVIGSRIGHEALAAVLALPERDDLTPAEAGAEQMRLIWPGYFADPASAPPAPPMALDPVANGALMADASALLADGVLAGGLPGLRVPSVHLIGRASPIDPEANRATAALCHEAVVIELDTGHFPWIEAPGSLTDAVRRLPT